MLNGYTLDAASFEEEFDKINLKMGSLTANINNTSDELSSLSYSGFPRTGSIRRTSHIITIITVSGVGAVAMFTLIILLYRLIKHKKKEQQFTT